jgi:NADH:ubiquinone oxidoreductase subunit 2 (subunit N)
MRLLLLFAFGGVGAGVSAWALPRGGRWARIGAVVGVLALAGLVVASAVLREGRLTETGAPEAGIFAGHLVGTGYLRLILGLWGMQAILLVALAWLLGGLPRLRGFLPGLLAAMTGGAVAMASADLVVGAIAAAAAGVAALLVILAVEGPAAVAAGARELRIALLGCAVLLVALGVVPLAARLVFIESGVGTEAGPASVAGGVAGPAMGLVAITMAMVLAARWGMLPFHVRVSRLTDLVPPETLGLLVAWAAVPLTVVTLAAIDRLVAPLALPLDGERAILVTLALATMAGGALAAFFNDDLRHAAGYLVIADAGLLLLAIAALEPDAWGPARAWVVALAASKAGLFAWVAVAEDRFGTRSVPDLRGWIRRSPILAAALVVVTIATYGLPGWVAFDARVGLASAAVGSPWQVILVLAGLLTLPTYLRILGTGTGRATSRVDGAAPERIVRRRKPREQLVVEQEAGTVAPSTSVPGPEMSSATPKVSTRAASLATRGSAAGGTVAAVVRRDRAELLSATVLALAVLAALASWGALDLAATAAEPAPILLPGAGD